MKPQLMFHRHQCGWLLVQQMIGLALSGILLLMLISAVVLQWQAFRQQSQLVFLQQTAVQSQALLQRVLTNSSFWAGLSLSQLQPSDRVVQGDCFRASVDSGSFPQANSVWLRFYSGSAGSSAAPSCLTNALRTSDFIQLKHLGGDPLTSALLRANRVYLQQRGMAGRFVSSGDSNLSAQAWYWPYQHELYYVAQQSIAGHQVPVLMRKRLIRNTQGQLAIDTAAMLDGVEMLFIEIGLDQDADGHAEQFVPSPQLSAEQWRQAGLVRQIRYFVLLRALTPERGYRNAQRYTMGQRHFQARGDPYRRLLISSSVKF